MDRRRTPLTAEGLKMSIRALLADDHQIVREGLRLLLERTDDMEIVGEASDGEEAVRLAGEVNPDVVILDVARPGLDGIGAARQIKADAPHVKVIALSMHSDQQFVSEMLQAGASAYLLKECAYRELATAVRSVVANGTYLSPGVVSVLVEDYVQRVAPEKRGRPSRLTGREVEVLRLIADGSATKQVARQLEVSVKTVDTHRRRIMKKLELDGVAELTKYAIREGLVSLETP